MELLQAIILGIVQGITEWLPVSSSGHLAIIQQVWKIEAPVFFDILLHLGTILAVIAVFWKDILEMFRAFFKFDFKTEYGKLPFMIVFAMVPTAVIGFVFKGLFESFFSNLKVIGVALIITGVFLFICERWEKKKALGFKESLLIGTAQGIAIIPGISRSGATIGTGLLAGVDKRKAARFSFLLSIPAIIGAALFDFSAAEINSVGLLNAAVGVAVAAVVGYFAINWLLKVIEKKRFHWFAVYCWAIGIIVLFYSLFQAAA